MPHSPFLSGHSYGAESAPQPEDALRGCSLSSLLRNRSLLRNSGDNNVAHTMSAPVDSLDIFLSHAWSDSGLWKQIALLLCCSPPIAYKTTILLSILGAWILVGRFGMFIWDTIAVLSLGVVAFLVCTISFSLYKHRNTMVFLDKCCINQTDLTEKARGISRLSDYLQNSDKLIILWTPNYLDRLWCVYELAVFMRTHDTKDVIVVNLGHVKLTISLTIVLLFIMVGQRLVLLFTHDLEYRGYMYCSICEIVVTCALVCRKVHHCSEEWITFASKLKSFEVSHAKCTSNDDYNMLSQLICEMYGSEAHFATVVQHLCLGGENTEHAPMWFLSQTSWRIMTAPFVPAIAEGVVWVILFVFTESANPVTRIIPPGEKTPTALEIPSTLATLAWAIRTQLLPALLRSFQAPLMLSLAHKLARQKPWLRRGSLSGIQCTFACIAFTWLSRAACGLGLFHIHLSQAPAKGIAYEALSLSTGFIVLGVVWSLSKWTYALRLPRIIS